jgi:hypothetical protein
MTMFPIYFLDNDTIKQNNFLRLLDKINEDGTLTCINGFGNEFRRAYESYELIQEKIQLEDGYWLLDLKFQEYHHENIALQVEVVQKLKEEYINHVEDLTTKFEYFRRIGSSGQYDLSIAMIVILKNKGIPFSIISTANVPTPFLTLLDREFRYEYTEFPIDPDEDDFSIRRTALLLADLMKDAHSYPLKKFFETIKDINAKDCHLFDSHKSANHKIEFFRPLSKLLYTPFDHFYSLFDLDVYRRKPNHPHVFEELLKTFACKDGNIPKLSLFGIMVISWAAIKNMLRKSTDLKDTDSKFQACIQSVVTAYDQTYFDAGSEAKMWKTIVRGKSFIPSQHLVVYSQTLEALYEMIQKIAQDEKRKKQPTIVEVNISADGNFSLKLKIDADGLISTLNEVQSQLIGSLDGLTFSREHVTSTRILKWQLYSQMSTKSALDDPSEYQMGTQQWGHSSSFWITRIDSETLKFNFKI